MPIHIEREKLCVRATTYNADPGSDDAVDRQRDDQRSKGPLRSLLPRTLLVLGILTSVLPAAGITPQELRAAFGPGMRRGLVVGDSIARASGVPGMRARDTFTFKFFEAGIFTVTLARKFEMAINLPRYVDAVTEMNTLDPWDFTLILLGTNDYAASIPLPKVLDAYAQFLRSVQGHASFRRLKNSYQTLICVTPLQRADEEGPNRAGYTMSDLRKAISELCRKLDVPVIDGLSLLLNESDIEAAKKSEFFADGVHPNQLGHDLIAERLLRQIVDHFKQHPTWYDSVWLKRQKQGSKATQPTPASPAR